MIYLYKVMIIDDKISVIGSANINDSNFILIYFIF